MQKDKDEQGYIPPPAKPERSTTRGRMPVPIKSAAECFRVDKQWNIKANPIANDAQMKYEQWDRKMMEKKRKQKLLKQKLIEEEMKIKE